MKIFFKGLNTCVQRRDKLQQYRNFLTANGHEVVRRLDGCDAILVWTCAFRKDVRDNSVAQLRRYRNLSEAPIFVGGCLPDINPEMLAADVNATVISWRRDEELLPKYFGSGTVRLEDCRRPLLEPPLCEDAVRFRRENPDKDAMFHDQFIKLVVSEGCSNRCSYCSERLAFPPFRSYPPDELIDACRELLRQTNSKRMVLIADSLGEYGRDIGTNLFDLIYALRESDRDLRFALNNYNISDFIRDFDSMIRLLEEGLVIHLNLPIQSASASILKLMRRPYDRSDMDEVFGALNRLEFTEVDTHIIIGFPGETNADFEETIDFLLRHSPKYVLASTYMESPNMASAMLPNKVGPGTVFDRTKVTVERCLGAGILCNTDLGQFVRDRLDRINRDI